MADDARTPRMWRAAPDDAAAPRSRLASYLHHTSGPLTGFLMGLPLTLLYSVGTALRGPAAGGDFLTNLQRTWLGDTGHLVLQLSLVAAFLVAVLVLQRTRRFEWRYFGPLLVESTLYAVVVVALMWGTERALGVAAPHHSIHPTREAALLAAVGEAVNEETFFRWLMVPAVLWVLAKVGVTSRYARGLLGALVSALLYAVIAWSIGTGMGDTRTFAGFLSLCLAGLVFTGLFVLRGYTVSAYTHLLYAIYWAVTAPLLAAAPAATRLATAGVAP